VVIDPDLAASQPSAERAASALNALAHAAEALWTPRRNPVCDLAALRAAQLLAQGVERDDREALALGSTLAAYAMGSTGIAIVHVLGQSLVAAAGVPHAGAYAVVLPHVLRLLEPRVPETLARLGAALGGDAAERTAALTARTGATRLRELGADEAGLERTLAAALGRAELAATPDPPGADELRALLRAAY
jgi:alcohol dehydrogenase class IV